MSGSDIARWPPPQDAALRFGPVRRAHTLPINFSGASRTAGSEDGPASKVEVLYSHRSVRIIAFSPQIGQPRAPALQARSARNGESVEIGTLPWASSRTERLIATGPIQLYRAPASVVILNFGSMVHPLLPKSQCWCVDGETKMVLRIRDNSYYRIELPNQSAEDLQKAEEMKAVLARVLQFEKTPCPFKRGFTVELPEAPSTPVKKRPWRPRPRLGAEPEQVPPMCSIGADEVGVDESGSLHAAEPIWLELDDGSGDEYVTALSRNNSLSSIDDDEADQDGSDRTPRASISGTMLPAMDPLRTPTRPRALAPARSVTAPPHLHLTTTPPSRSSSPGLLDGQASRPASTDSFQSASLPPSPPESTASSPAASDGPFGEELFIARQRPRADGSSTMSTSPGSAIGSASAALHKVTLVDAAEAPSDSAAEAADRSDDLDGTPLRVAHARRRMKARQQAGKATVVPRPIVLSSATADPRGHGLTTAILQKTCALLMITPAQLLRLMLEMARKVASGAMQGVAIGYGEGGEKIPCSWMSSDDEDGMMDEDDVVTGARLSRSIKVEAAQERSEDTDDAWSEDDYGLPLDHAHGLALRRRDLGGAWHALD